MENYRINTKTLAIIPINKKRTKVYEFDNVIIVNQNAHNIISENCKYYGSTYEGRKRGTTELTGVTHKAPILVEDSQNLIFFPTSSPRLHDCNWISLNNIKSSMPFDGESLIKFNNNLIIQVSASNKIITNQVLRATRLESIIYKRKKNLYDSNFEKKD